MKKNFKLLMLTLIMGGGLFASEAMALDKIGDVYQIGAAQDLKDFANLVDASGGAQKNAVLTADIILPYSTNADYMIGESNNDYVGTFDGQGHTITVEFHTGFENTALFRQVTQATIKNLVVNGNIVTGGDNGKFAGGIVGTVWGNATIENCVSAVIITDGTQGNVDHTHGGICGRVGYQNNPKVTIKNCAFIGAINAPTVNGCAGILGWGDSSSHHKIENCYVSGTLNVEGNSNAMITRADNNSFDVTNTFYLGGNDSFSYKPGTKKDDINAIWTELQDDGWNRIAEGTNPYPGSSFIPNVVNGYYELSTSAHLANFAELINKVNTSKNARLMADFTSGGDIMVGMKGHPFAGELNGQGHTVTVYYRREENYGGADENAYAAGELGLIRRINGGTVKNLIVDGTIDTKSKCAGGVVSGIWQKGVVENCVSYVTINDDSELNNNNPTDATHGGIVARVSDKGGANSIIIRNCAFLGTINASNRTGCGGILGWPDNASDNQVKIENCLMAGTLNLAQGQDINNDVICRDNYTMTNCYATNLDNLKNSHNATITSDDLVNKLGAHWYQGTSETLPRPIALTTDKSLTDGYYELGSAKDLVWLSSLVDCDNTTVNARLTNDIDFSDVDFPGIGSSSNHFNGFFDGQKHRISNLTMSMEGASAVGFFRYVTFGGTTIKRFTIDSSCSFTGKEFVGAFVGHAENANGDDTIILEELGNEAEVTASDKNGGGILGVNTNHGGGVIIKNCYNAGTINGGNDGGAISGWLGNDKARVINCYNIGTINGNGSRLARSNGGQQIHCYTNSEAATSQYEISIDKNIVDNDISDGTVFASLFDYKNENPAVNGSVWRMYFDADDATKSHPVLYDAAIVYKEDFPNRPVVQSEAKTVKLYRQTVAGSWNTVCLPFELTSAQIKSVFGDDANVAELTSDDNDVLHFTKISGNMEAGKAYLVKPSDSNAADTYKELKVTISKAAPDGLDDVNAYGGFKFVGNFWPINLSTNGDDYVMAAKNTIKKAPAGREMNAFRAYLHDTTTPASPSRATSFVIDDEGTTGIITATGDVIENGKMYNLNGQRINEPQRGLYIVNGKKYIK